MLDTVGHTHQLGLAVGLSTRLMMLFGILHGNAFVTEW